MSPDEWYKSLPVVTRVYVTLAFLTTALCALELVRPFQLYFDPRYILVEGQFWRLATNFFFFGNLGLDFVFHMFFLVKYCKSLEEDAFRNRPADFLWMLLFGAALLTALAPIARVHFLGSSLTFMMVYMWGRRHPYVQLSFLGVFNFTAPYLPWVLLAFSVMLGSSPVVDLLGVAAGHVYYFLEDVYPRMSGGRRPLRTPGLLKALFPPAEGPALADEAAARVARAAAVGGLGGGGAGGREGGGAGAAAAAGVAGGARAHDE